MISKSVTFLLIFCLLLAGCGGSSVSKPTVISDAESYTNDGLQAFLGADWNRSQWSLSKALSLYEGIDNQMGVLYSHINLAEVALSVEDYPAIHRHLQRAASIAKEDSFKDVQPRITLLYSLAALKQKQIMRAESLLKPLLLQFEGEAPVVNPNTIQLVAIANQTKIAFVKKQDELLWTNRYASALNSSAENNPDLEARLLRFQSRLFQQKGDFREAESHLQQALSNYKNSLSRSGIAMTLLALGELYMEQEEWRDAKDYLNRSIAVFRHLKNAGKITHISKKLLKVDLKLKQF
jgi:tetratricopeptide (TPR) repeat protein